MSRGCLPLAVAVVLLVAGAAVVRAAGAPEGSIQRVDGSGGATPPTPPTSVVDPPGTAPGTTIEAPPVIDEPCTVRQGLFERECTLYRPDDAAAGERFAVVVLLHGFATAPSEVRDNGRWLDEVAQRRFVLVTPRGVADSWNAGGCCGIPRATNFDDVGFLVTLLSNLAARPDVDPARIMLAGHSNGGMMAYRAVCDAAVRVAAVASMAGSDVSGCPPARPVRTLHIHGTADQVVPYDGGVNLAETLLGADFPPAPAAVAARAAAQGCPEPVDETAGAVTIRRWVGCSEGVEVRFVTIAGANHDWQRVPVFDATAAMVEFFGL